MYWASTNLRWLDQKLHLAQHGFYGPPNNPRWPHQNCTLSPKWAKKIHSCPYQPHPGPTFFNGPRPDPRWFDKRLHLVQHGLYSFGANPCWLATKRHLAQHGFYGSRTNPRWLPSELDPVAKNGKHIFSLPCKTHPGPTCFQCHACQSKLVR